LPAFDVPATLPQLQAVNKAIMKEFVGCLIGTKRAGEV
jgi:hypothetical protein